MLDRVRRAYWNHAYAMRTAYLDMRLPLVVSGLEALVNVGKDVGNTRSFRRELHGFGVARPGIVSAGLG